MISTSLRTRQGWRELDALRRGNIVIVSDAIIARRPRMVDAVEQLARAFHSNRSRRMMAHRQLI